VPRLRAEYDKTIRSQLTEKFGYANVMQVPRLDKVVLNMGIGEPSRPQEGGDGGCRSVADRGPEGGS